MDTIPFNQTPLFAWVILPVLIFVARIMDVSIGTIRVIFISRGMKLMAPLLGFFEVLIWIIAMTQIMQNLSNIVGYIAWASGYATGTYVGIILENRIAIGKVILRVITRRDATDLVEVLRNQNYGVTSLDAEGATGPVKLIFMLVDRKDIDPVIEIVNRYHPHAFYSIEDVRFAKEGVFPMKSHRTLQGLLAIKLTGTKKGK